MSLSKFSQVGEFNDCVYVLDTDGFAKTVILDEGGEDIGLVLSRLQPEKIVRGKWQEKLADTEDPYKYRLVTSSHYREQYIEFMARHHNGVEKVGKLALCSIKALPILQRYKWHWSRMLGTIVTYIVLESGKKKVIYFRRLVMGFGDDDKRHLRHINKNGADLRESNLSIIGDIKPLVPIVKKTIATVVNIVKRERKFGNGKPTGSIAVKRGKYIEVSFTNGRSRTSKTFTISHFDSEKDARRAAETYRYGESLRRGEVYNQYRRVWTDDGTVLLEVEAHYRDTTAIFICNYQDLEIVKSRIWHISTEGYVKTRDNDYFHQKVLPGYGKVDHINGNGKDNRRANLRDGSNGVNDRNQKKSARNTSGITGVQFLKDTNAWSARWKEDGKNRSKTFSVKEYGDKARQLAIDTRQAVNERLGMHVCQTVDASNSI